ncbi:transporter substrate-binding domain-containing protein [Grimontia kaedaensis]|uniref:Transporter substrate-binding domain-containing protein n=1 Tax=Grimontia kaedaensis TaxID=2872157 RepID=A0ABY4WU50_9GAMM|nr:transporter substrate-binding domain-containing protein [Grimontia kaedaensis]USH02134.1 transporter substrate-binding domain-containing protein [Grimontia kaedaensis]
MSGEGMNIPGKSLLNSAIRYLFALPLLIASQPAISQTFTVMTEDFAPFGYVENGKLTGLSVEIVREIFAIVEHPDDIELLPWARAFKETQRKENRILFSMSRTKAREPMFKWVGPLVEDRVSFFCRKDGKVDIQSLDDAREVSSILVTRGFPETDFLQAQEFNNLHMTNSPTQSFTMLAMGRGDLAPIGEFAYKSMIQKSDIAPDAIEKTDITLFNIQLYIAFSKNTSDEEIARWQAALDQVKASGKYAEIISKYSELEQ